MAARPERRSADGAVREAALDLLDLAHFSAIGEARPMRFEWWRARFRPDLSEQAAGRAWERLKAEMREAGVPFDLVDEQTGDDFVMGRGRGGAAAIVLNVPGVRRVAHGLLVDADDLLGPQTADLWAGRCETCGGPIGDDEPDGLCEPCALAAIRAAGDEKRGNGTPRATMSLETLVA